MVGSPVYYASANATVIAVLDRLFHNDILYYALAPATDDEDEGELEVSILKSAEEDGESILSIIEDEQELQTVYDLIMDSLYAEEEDDEDDDFDEPVSKKNKK